VTDIVVNADYSQVYVIAGDPHEPDSIVDPTWSNPLMSHEFGASTQIIVPREYGDIPFEVQMLDASPGDPDPEWDDVVELSLAPTDRIYLAGWGDNGIEPGFEVDPARSYRVRYSTMNWDEGQAIIEGEPYPDRYRLQFWPEEPSPGSVLVQRSKGGRYWLVTHAMNAVWGQHVAASPDAVKSESEQERLVGLVLAAVPGLATQIRNGDIPWSEQIGNRFTPDPVNAAASRALVARVAALPQFDGEES
jgi:hypothetical protein